MNSSAKEIQMQYVSIRRVIEDANKKYKLFTGNQVEDDYLINTMQKTIIATIKKESNGIDYYMTSDTLEVAELVEIARSVSVLPVSK